MNGSRSEQGNGFWGVVIWKRLEGQRAPKTQSSDQLAHSNGFSQLALMEAYGRSSRVERQRRAPGRIERDLLRWSRQAVGRLRRLFLGVLFAALLSTIPVYAEVPGQGELIPPDISAPVAGDNYYYGPTPSAYTVQAPVEAPMEYPAAYEGQLFRAEAPSVELADRYDGSMPAYQQDPLDDIQQRFNALYDAARNERYPNATINGVFQADAGFFTQDTGSLASFGELQDGADFRRARLSAKGSVTENVNYMFQMDFAFLGRPTFTDVWMETVGLPVLGNVRVGQWKQPFSLEVVSSFRYTTFLERSLLFIPFVPFRHLGAGFYDHAENLRMTWAASGFRTGQDQFGDSISNDGGWGTAERITFLPWYDEASEGQAYLHLGLGHFFSNPPNDTFNFRTIPEFFVGEHAPGPVGTSGAAVPGALNGTPFFAKTGPLALSNYNVLGGELLLVRGPFSLQSEAMASFVNQIGNPNSVLWGAYAQVGWFLTGEHRPYDRVAGAIDRIIPYENFFRVRTSDGSVCNGRGAWEVAFRWSYLDLNDNNISGGRLTDLTAGLNWYWNPYTKMMFNYIHAFAEDPTFGNSDTSIYAVRAQVDF